MQDIKYYLNPIMQDKPDSRWQHFQQVFDSSGRAIGFQLPGNPFIFRYDRDGGWEDQKGNYFDQRGVLVELKDDDQEEEDGSGSDVDQFQELLREEEEGRGRESPKKAKGGDKGKKQEDDQFNFKKLIDNLNDKTQVKDRLPAELFIYFKQRVNFYKQVKPAVQKAQSVQQKNKVVSNIKAQIQKQRTRLLQQNPWLKQTGVFLDYSGDSQKQGEYDRYWYGYIRTSAQPYLKLLETIKDSKQFKLLQIKTFYALKSKFYPKKAQKLKQALQNLTVQINGVEQNKTVTFLIDGLPQCFPCSLVYDLLQYAGVSLEHVEQVVIKNDYSAEVTCLRQAAFKLINLQAYNHDKGEYLELSVLRNQQRKYVQGKHKFYLICVDSEFKIHERELNDTLGLAQQKNELARHNNKEQAQTQKGVRFWLGSIESLRRVLMFRGDSLNVDKVLPKVPQ